MLPPELAMRAFHPIADLFPLITGPDFEALVADVQAHGLREAIVLHADGRVLDGRNRLRACIAAGVEPVFATYERSDPLAYVVSLNLRRRHLDETQRALVAARIATLGVGRPSTNPANLPGIGQAEAAELLNVSERSVRSAVTVRDHAIPALAGHVERGEVSVSAASAVARLPEDEQEVIVARGEREILAAAKRIRDARAAEREAVALGLLGERFGVAPFTVLNAREGWWQERKRGWLALGIQSELGRGDQCHRAPDSSSFG
ncbi:hypothetical protein [Lichenicoccus roseus]|uniref:hypothetical protein n=1 Tax=Lichenicoccus roseus TaxID=2683649 RepID=UPI00197DCF64|nr:hypothetical protein [Lichenicoccus roseus]